MPSSKPVAGLLAGLDPAIDAQEGIGFDASATRRDGGVVDGAGDRIYLCLRRKSASSMRVIFRDANRKLLRWWFVRRSGVDGGCLRALVRALYCTRAT